MTAPQPEAITAAMVDAGEQAIAGAERDLAGHPIRQYPVSWRRTIALAVLAATQPPIAPATPERSERERIAAQIRAQKQPCKGFLHNLFPKPSCWCCGRNGAFERAAKIAEGTF